MLACSSNPQPSSPFIRARARWSITPNGTRPSGAGPPAMPGKRRSRPGRSRGISINDAEIRIHAEPGADENVAGAVVDVEIAAVVEVAVAGRHPVHRHTSLVHRVLIERNGHGCQSHR